MQTYPQNIVDKFGGPRQMARLTGYPVSTIASWLSRAAIHDDHKPTILKAARENAIALGPEDFFPTPTEGLPTAAR